MLNAQCSSLDSTLCLQENKIKMSDWSQLPFSEICDRLDLSGLFSFNHVCSSWRRSSAPTLKRHLGFLFIAQKNFSHQGSIWFFSPLQTKFYNIKLPNGIKSGKICGFSDGWLALEDDDLNLTMLLVCSSANPVHLPPLLPPNQKDEPTYKTVRMSPDHSVFMAIDRCSSTPGRLYIFRPEQDLKWIPIQINFYDTPITTRPLNRQIPRVHYRFDDLIFFKGKFYAVNCNGFFAVVDPSPPSWTTKTIDTRTPCMKEYFVVISGELRLVCLGLGCFMIEKLENDALADTEGELGENALLLSRHHSCLVPSTEFPCLKANYVYSAPDPYTKFKGKIAYIRDGIPFGFMGAPEYFS